MNKQEYPHCSLTCYRYQMNSLSRKDFALLALLTLTWGINWPIMKIGVQYFPALSFRALSMIGGLAAIWLATRYQKISLSVPKEQIIPIIKLAIPNMLIWHVFMIRRKATLFRTRRHLGLHHACLGSVSWFFIFS